MRMKLISDVHTEFHRDHGREFFGRLETDGVDVLIVAGDLTIEAHMELALSTLCDMYPHVIYVTGNHEYYKSSRIKVHATLSRLTARYSNLHWLENGTVTLSGRRFVGCSLWFTDDPDGLNRVYGKFLSDFRAIEGFEQWVYDINRGSRDFLMKTVGPEDIVVTHHLPHPDAVAPIFRTGKLAPMNRFFLCDMSALIQKVQPRLWCFGHTHHAVDTWVGGTRLLCNPLGYPHEPNLGFRGDLTVMI
jgi:predicted phosphodiesterase